MVDGDDPMQVGVKVDVTGTADEIHAEMAELVNKEGRYATYAGIECGLKWGAGHAIMGGTVLSCYTCPNYTEYKEGVLGGVCRVGRQQEDLVAMLEAIQREEADSLDAELARHFSDEIEFGAELAEALA